MGLITIHLVIGVGLLILTLLVFFLSITNIMTLANLYIIVGTISFVVSIVTAIVLVTKFINQPVAHGFFSYSDILSSALLSLAALALARGAVAPRRTVPAARVRAASAASPLAGLSTGVTASAGS